MAQPDSNPVVTPRKRLSLVASGSRPPQCDDGLQISARRRRPRPTPHMTPDEYIRLLAFIEDEGGIVTIDEISRALPRVARPVSAVFDLCDAGVLNVDWESAFNGDMRVWRVDR